MPQNLTSSDHACGDEDGGGQRIPLQDRKCIFVIVAIAVVESDRHSSIRDIPGSVSLYQFHKRYHLVTAAQKSHLLIKNIRMNRFEEGMGIGRDFMIRQNLKAPRQPRM